MFVLRSFQFLGTLILLFNFDGNYSFLTEIILFFLYSDSTDSQMLKSES